MAVSLEMAEVINKRLNMLQWALAHPSSMPREAYYNMAHEASALMNELEEFNTELDEFFGY